MRMDSMMERNSLRWRKVEKKELDARTVEELKCDLGYLEQLVKGKARRVRLLYEVMHAESVALEELRKEKRKLEERVKEVRVIPRGRSGLSKLEKRERFLKGMSEEDLDREIRKAEEWLKAQKEGV